MTTTPAFADRLFAAAIPPAQPAWRRAASAAWTWGGLSALVALAWAEPFSARAFDALGLQGALRTWAAEPLVMVLRGILLVEAFGYVYHRFFQHVGFLTRRSIVFRRNQRFHWIHHMIIYPIGRWYKQAGEYVQAEDGIAWSWVAPGLGAGALALATMGVVPGTFAFLASIGVYAKFVIDKTHSRFHEAEHPWTDSPYFRWLEDIHLLHHWDQRKNFTIVHPLMDVLFGTWLDPKKHPAEVKVAEADQALTVSDLINWRYLLIEATPAEYAAFISAAKQHPRSVRKLDGLLQLLATRVETHPEDAHAAELDRRARDLARILKPEPAAA